MANSGPKSGLAEIELKVLGDKGSSSTPIELESIPNLQPKPSASLQTPTVKPTASMPITIPGKEGQLREEELQIAKEEVVSSGMSRSLPTKSTPLPFLAAKEKTDEDVVLATSYRSQSFVPHFREKKTVAENPLLSIIQKGEGETGLIVGSPDVRDGCPPKQRYGFF